MAVPMDFAGANEVLNPAQGDEGTVAPMRCYMGEQGIIQRWRLTPAELAQVVASGGDVWLQMPIRSRPPPMFVSGFPLMERQPDEHGIRLLYDPDEGLAKEEA